MTLIKKFFDSVDLTKIKTAPPPELIFLCGGTDTEKDKYFRPQIYDKLKEQGRKIVLAETAMDWQGGQSFSKDLLELEKYFAALVSLIPIVCESHGSIAELGAFVSDKVIRNKLYIIIQEKFYVGQQAKSFIRWGPIENYKKNVERDNKDQHKDNKGERKDKKDQHKDNKNKLYCFNEPILGKDLMGVCDALINCKPKTTPCDFSNSYFHILLLIDIINILSVANIKEIKIALSYALVQAKQKSLGDSKKISGVGYEVSYAKISEMLVVLIALDLIKERIVGEGVRYFIAKQKEFYLDYNNKKITDVKKEIISKIYLKHRIKASILKEERNKGDIAWLKKPDLSQLEQTDINNTIRKAPLLYKVYEISKKNKRKGKRTIAQPTPKLKKIQRETVLKLEKTMPVHPSAKAYIKGVNGILANAEAHKDSKFFFKYDFTNFFPSIKAADFNKHLEKAEYAEYNEQDRIDFLRIFFRFDKQTTKGKPTNVFSKLRNKDLNEHTNATLLKLITKNYKDEFQLSIGAPSSPFVSNVIMFDFDTHMDKWAKENGFIYTRFADDITISCQKPETTKTITAVLNKTLKGLDYPTLQLNDSKQKSVSLKSRVTITGLNITSEHKVSLGRKKKKTIRAMIDHYVKGTFPKHKINELSGWLAYANAVDNDFFKSMQKKYTPERIASIMQRPK